MRVITVHKTRFEIRDYNNQIVGEITYTNNTFKKANIEIKEKYALAIISTGTWETSSEKDRKVKAKIKVEAGSLMSINFPLKRKKYMFKKSGGLKLRFLLFNKEGEELLSILPLVNWQKQSHDFVLQINEDFEKECDGLLILQALHCALCCLSMMTGGEVPALVSI